MSIEFVDGVAYMDGIPVKSIVESAERKGLVSKPAPLSYDEKQQIRILELEQIDDDDSNVQIPPVT